VTRSSNTVQNTPLDELLQKADADTLRDLARNLIGRKRKAQRESLDFLRQRLELTDPERQEAAGQSVLMLWQEAEWYLESDDREGEENRASDILTDLAERLRDEQIPQQVRCWILSEGIAYVDSFSCTDPLYDVLYAACYKDNDRRDLAENLEGTGSDWPLEHARRIYRSLGNREKYLEFRTRRLVDGLDYYDLVTFYDESGEPENALAVAKGGLEHRQGRLDELRQYLADHAHRAGDRETYLKLHFEEAVQRITVESYQLSETSTPGRPRFW